jgi:hypothetical protein
VKYAHPTKESPELLVLDGHCSHKELQVILYARANHAHMLCTPLYATYKLQPLDRTFMKPFAEACPSSMRTYPELRINEYDFAQLISAAYSKVCRMEIAQNGFSCTGIFPKNQDVFSDLDYLPSHLTEIQQIGEDSGSVDKLRRLETTENNVRTEEVSLEPSDGRQQKIMFAQKRCPLNPANHRQWKVIVVMLKRSSKRFRPFHMPANKGSKVKKEMLSKLRQPIT